MPGTDNFSRHSAAQGMERTDSQVGSSRSGWTKVRNRLFSDHSAIVQSFSVSCAPFTPDSTTNSDDEPEDLDGISKEPAALEGAVVPKNAALHAELLRVRGEQFRRRALRVQDAPDSSRQAGGGAVSPAGRLAPSTRAPALASWPRRDDENYKRGTALISSVKLDALTFTADDLCHLALHLFQSLHLPSRLNLKLPALQGFILAVRAHMLDNPYHNWHHAFDVTQTLYALATASGVLQRLSPVEQLSLLLAALCHDLEHPGVNNNFLTEAEPRLWHAAGASSTLERHHFLRGLQIIRRPDINLMAPLSFADRSRVETLMQRLILATDMARHSEFVALLVLEFVALLVLFPPSFFSLAHVLAPPLNPKP